MPKLKYIIRPTDQGYSSDYATLHARPGSITWPAKNLRIEQHSLWKRWGYLEDRDLGTGVNVLGITIYQLTGAVGTRNTLYLTDTDLCLKETSKFSYKTDTGDYNASVDSISTTAVTFKASTIADTEDIVAGDKFILDMDHSPLLEPDTNWRTIQSVSTAGGYFTGLTLTATYAPGTEGSWTGAEKDCLIRRVYTVPSYECWQWAVVANKFCFTNGNVNVQYWTGSNYATSLDSTNAKQARYCIEYANRLLLADLLQSGTRDQLTVQWSKENDPTNWIDATAGSNQLLQSDDYITGLGKIGPNLIVYKEKSIIVASRTGVSTNPIIFPTQRMGIGCSAPYSIVEANYTNYFLGREDFYKMLGDQPVSIGENIRDKFFAITTMTNAERAIGFAVENKNEVHWIVTTTEGQLDFVYNWRLDTWYIYQFYNTLGSGGKGAIS